MSCPSASRPERERGVPPVRHPRAQPERGMTAREVLIARAETWLILARAFQAPGEDGSS